MPKLEPQCLFCAFWRCIIISITQSVHVPAPVFGLRSWKNKLSTLFVRRPECCEVGLSRAFRALCSKNISCHTRHLGRCELRCAICAQQTGHFGGPQCTPVFSLNAELRRCVDKNLISSQSFAFRCPARLAPKAVFRKSQHHVPNVHPRSIKFLPPLI